MVVCDILSRVPVKSLLRFKGVYKPWCSLIQDGYPYFIDLHFARSQILQHFFFIIPLVGSETENQIRGIYYQDYQVYFKTTGLLSQGSGRMASTIPTIRNLKSAQCSEIIGAVNGLTCFVRGYDAAACIYNISTREITPWIKSTVLREAREGKTCCYIGSPTYCFGYDSATKKHKVMCMWNMSRKQDDGTFVNGPVCEILTLGHNSWRKIEAAPPRHFYRAVCSVYVNGSIYWLPDMFEYDNWNNGDNVFMVAFDVGSEKFRTIQISKFRSGNRPSDPHPFLNRCHLLEVNECVAILRRSTADTANLWIYEDSDKESTYKATIMDSADKNWTENTITLPVP
ncbi:hypothetical protein MKX01_016700 [Papaver californicum]|nr:hypothetical protein MKX01_016700 [Papaver californicum]